MVTIRIKLPSYSHDVAQAEPVRVVDHPTERVYYLISAEQFEKLYPSAVREAFEPQKVYPLISRPAAQAGWTDPLMDDYDHYDEIRPAG